MNPTDADDRTFMERALEEAREAERRDEVPVGCVVVHGGSIVGRAHNLRQTLRDPTAHAEMIAITQAAEALGDWRLGGTVLYVTLEPCIMCAGAIVLGRIDRVVFGAPDPKAGAFGSVFDIREGNRLNHSPAVTGGVMASECGGILSAFFARLRGD
jgi:tRNA(adenine34) deaminase